MAGDDLSTALEVTALICGAAGIVTAATVVGAITGAGCFATTSGLSTTITVSRGAICANSAHKGQNYCDGATADVAYELVFLGFGQMGKLITQRDDLFRLFWDSAEQLFGLFT